MPIPLPALPTMRITRTCTLTFTLALALIVACHAPATQQSPAPTRLQQLADQPLDEPPVTTERVWAAVSAPENVVDGEVGRWVRNAMYLAFKDGVPLARRQQLLDSVQARAVGGHTLGSTRFYLLVFEHLRPAPRDAALDALFTLADGLRDHPDVRGVRTIDLTPLFQHQATPAMATDLVRLTQASATF